MFFVDFSIEITEKGLKWSKKVEDGWKKVFWPAYSCSKYTTYNTAGWVEVKNCLKEPKIGQILPDSNSLKIMTNFKLAQMKPD